MNKEKAGKPPKGQGDEAFVSAECPKLCKTFMGKQGQTGLSQEEETAWRKPDFSRMQGDGAQSCIALYQGLPQAFCTVAAAKKHPGLRISPGCFRLSINLFLKIEQYKNNVRIHGHVPGILTP